MPVISTAAIERIFIGRFQKKLERKRRKVCLSEAFLNLSRQKRNDGPQCTGRVMQSSQFKPPQKQAISVLHWVIELLEISFALKIP